MHPDGGVHRIDLRPVYGGNDADKVRMGLANKMRVTVNQAERSRWGTDTCRMKAYSDIGRVYECSVFLLSSTELYPGDHVSFELEVSYQGDNDQPYMARASLTIPEPERALHLGLNGDDLREIFGN